MRLPKRGHARLPCELAVEVFTGPVGGLRLGEGTLLDLSLSGGFLRTAQDLRAGGSYRLRLAWLKHAVDLPGRVVREAASLHGRPVQRRYGLHFTLSAGQEAALRALLDELRRVEKPGEDRFLRGYWDAPS